MKRTVLLLSLLVLPLAACRPSAPDNVVVVYTSQDEVYAEPILADFTKATGIQVKTVFDSESAVKTVGLVNRLC